MEPSDAGQCRRLVSELPGPVSLALQRRRDRAVTTAVSTSVPLFIEAAEGAILIDVDGNRLIDLGSGIAVSSVGHRAPTVVEAVSNQAAHFSHTSFMINPYEGYVAVCERLNACTPGEHDKRSALFNSGAEAVENVVKVARRVTGRQAVVVFDHAYHGRTNLTMALTARNLPYRDGFGPFSPEVYRAPTSYPFRDPEGMTGRAAADRAIGLIERQVGAANVACLLIEPIQGEGGFVVPAPGFLPALASWCADQGILLAADEIQTGFCRTGRWFACEDESIVPDLVATAKALGGGLPLSAVTGRADLMDAVHPGGLGGTFGGNPIACAAALASIDLMEANDLPSAARHIESIAMPRLMALAGAHRGIGDVRGRGAMLGLELVLPGTSEPDPSAARRVVETCLRSGVVALTCGTFGNVIRLLPPLTIDHVLLLDGLDVLGSAIDEVLDRDR
ncbi:MAG: 4-aminobutyrate--2-oxoglutarate transaminase [Acidimicrobiales bacterium]